MKYRVKQFALSGLLLIVPFTINAQSSGGDFEISKQTVDGGGGTSTGGTFSLTGTIGQPDAQRSEGGQFVLHGGFWGGPAEIAERLFSDGFEG